MLWPLIWKIIIKYTLLSRALIYHNDTKYLERSAGANSVAI